MSGDKRPFRTRLPGAWDGRLKAIWKRLLHEHAAPRKVGGAVALGLFIGASPVIFFHAPIAVGLATVFRVNRLWAAVSTKFGNIVTIPWIAFAEVQLSHRIRTGEWLQVTGDHILHNASEYLLDWILGTIPVGGALAVVGGMSAYIWARRRARSRAV